MSFALDYSVWLLPSILVAAILYSSVGFGGASGYLAAMALFGLDPAVMKPAALTMNIFVTLLVLFRLSKAGYFNWRLFAPFIIGSIPMAFIGGGYPITSTAYQYIVGSLLILSVIGILLQRETEEDVRSPKAYVTLPVGGVLGFFSGLSGVGGGIFLGPLLVLFRWTTMRGSAAMVAAFVLINSVAGLAGYIIAAKPWPHGVPIMVVFALSGAVVGSELAVRQLAPRQLRYVLGVVLAIAGVKMITMASSL